MMDLDTIVNDVINGYVECATWADLPINEDGTGHIDPDPDDDFFDRLADDPRLIEAVRGWVEANIVDVVHYADARSDQLVECEVYQHVGHDLWLTEKHHGAGFWDRGLGELGGRLTASCRPPSGPDGLYYDENNRLQWEGL